MSSDVAGAGDHAVGGAPIDGAEGATRRGHRSLFTAEGAGARVLGIIVAAAIMAAAGELGSVTDVAISVLVAVAIYWIAEAYSRAVETRLLSAEGSWRALTDELREHWPMVEAAVVPVLAMVVAAAFGADDSVAITVGLATATALLFVFAWIASRTGGLSGRARVGMTLVVGALGAAMIIMKTYLHLPRH